MLLLKNYWLQSASKGANDWAYRNKHRTVSQREDFIDQKQHRVVLQLSSVLCQFPQYLGNRVS